jgi:DNA-binding SARP family transcriptional activator
MEFRVLGPLQACSDGREIAVSAGRQRALLAGLLLRANRVVPTVTLIGWLWGSAPPADARATIQTYVGRLRRKLGDGLIVTRPDGYLITLTAHQLDLAGFDDLLERARHAVDPAVEADLLKDALALWRGPALGDVPSEVLHRDEVPALTERWLHALQRRIELDLIAERHAELVAELRALTREYPLQEQFWAQLMRALAGCGRQAEALQAYQDLRSHLADELGADPCPAVQELHRALLRGDVRHVAVQRPSHDSGRLPVPAQLPPDVAGFVGRDKLLATLDSQLGDATSPLVIMAMGGAAGIGKTTLAVHWAHRVIDWFPDGQLYANLRGFDPSGSPRAPEEVLRGFLEALQVPPQQVPSGFEAQVGLYRSLLAGRRMLIVLDNARAADQVRPLLPGSPGSQVVVTSRDALTSLIAAEGARPVVLDVLSAE